MSSYSRRLLIGAGLALLAGCGFAPAYAPGGAGAALMGQVEVAAPDDRVSYLMTRELETRLGRASDPRYALSHDMAIVPQAIAIDRSNVTLRFNLLGQARYALRDLSTDTVLVSGEVSNFTGYSTTGTTVAVQASERDAEARLVSVLVDQILTEVLATLPDTAR